MNQADSVLKEIPEQKPLYVRVFWNFIWQMPGDRKSELLKVHVYRKLNSMGMVYLWDEH